MDNEKILLKNISSMMMYCFRMKTFRIHLFVDIKIIFHCLEKRRVKNIRNVWKEINRYFDFFREASSEFIAFKPSYTIAIITTFNFDSHIYHASEFLVPIFYNILGMQYFQPIWCSLLVVNICYQKPILKNKLHAGKCR